jgi:glutamyl-tRNA synthetase
MEGKVRVRFAPSPTGPLHIGGVRTALYNFLFAMKNGGTFIVRIEDTDQSRFVGEAERYIYDSLKWLGIEPRESTLHGGSYGSYRQSERKAIYQEYARKLVDSGHAYYAFDTPEELETKRNEFRSHSQELFQYDVKTRRSLRNSLSLPAAEVARLMNEGHPYVIRFLVPEDEEVRFRDEVRGWVITHSSAIDDKVLMKSDGMPTYHLAVVVDDHLMEISHVIRGEEWLPSAPIHWLLYKYLGWMDHMPSFAHLPLLLKPEGSGKLSKRDAEKGGFPIFPIAWTDPKTGVVTDGFREKGYLPEAMVNFLAMLGWNPGTDREFFTMNELTREFTLDRVNKSGAKFDIEKAKFFNQHYIRLSPDSRFVPMVENELARNNIPVDPGAVVEVIGELKERVTFPQEFAAKSISIFRRPETYDKQVIEKKLTPDYSAAIHTLSERLSGPPMPVTADEFRTLIMETMNNADLAPGPAMQLIRVLVTGVSVGIDLMKTLEILGAPEVSVRLGKALAHLKPQVS